MAYNNYTEFVPLVCQLAVVWLFLAGLSGIWMNSRLQIRVRVPPQIFIMKLKLRDNGFMNMSSWWQSMEVPGRLADVCLVT